MTERTTREDALRMSRDLTNLIEQQQAAEQPHTELGDCIPMVAVCVWDAAWRQARNDQSPDEETSRQIEQLIFGQDFLKGALHRHNWRNVSAILNAFRDAGLAGSTDVAAFYHHIERIPNADATK